MVIKNKQRSITVSWLNFKLKEVDLLSIGHQKLVVCKHFNTTAFIFNTFSVTLIHFSDQICFQWSWKLRFRLVCSYDQSPAEGLRATDTGLKIIVSCLCLYLSRVLELWLPCAQNHWGGPKSQQGWASFSGIKMAERNMSQFESWGR